jgi:hypothetical protein
LLFETFLLSAAVFLETNPGVAKYAVVDVPPLTFIAMWFISYDSGGNE